jgi:tRNA threonylcarbamoyladenosine biosynthesis protein TsaB
MIHLLAIQSTYQAIEYALYEQERVIAHGTLDKMVASRNLIPALDELFVSAGVSLQDLSFCAVNCGPAPFTTLRVLMATVNGLQYAGAIPLVGVSGFDVWFCNLSDTSVATAIVMNAFNQEVYVGLRLAGEMVHQSWFGPIAMVVEQLRQCNGEIVLAGNAVALHREFFESEMPGRIRYAADDVMHNSLPHLARLGLQLWNQGKAQHTPLAPLYLKK